MRKQVENLVGKEERKDKTAGLQFPREKLVGLRSGKSSISGGWGS